MIGPATLAQIEADWKSNKITIPDMVAKYGLTAHRLRTHARAGGWGRKVRLSKAKPKPLPRHTHRCCDPDHCQDWSVCKALPASEPVKCEKPLFDEDLGRYDIEPGLYDDEPVIVQAIPIQWPISLAAGMWQDA